MVYLAADAKLPTNRLAEIAARAGEAHQQALALPAAEKGFGQVAADFSEDQATRYRGGDAGWFTGDFLVERWPKEVLAAGLALANVGDVSEIIHAADGFYFVKKMDARPSVVAPLAQVQGGIERRLLVAKREQMEKEFAASLRAGKVQTDLSLLSQVAYPTQSPVSVAALPPSLPGSP
jgi:parvulin-like peptidyl-prolyl isomerase